MIGPDEGEKLLDSDRRLSLFEQILKEIEARRQEDRAFVIGINGIDCSGKSIFAESFVKFLIARGFTTQTINLDDFHNPRAYRYSGKDQAENYYNKSFNVTGIINNLFVPIHNKDTFSTRLTLLNLLTDGYEIEKEFSFDSDTLVIFEGVFLFRRELSPYIDYKVFLEIPFQESKRRARIRDNKASLRKYDEKYLPAQRKYLEEYPPDETADMIIDNSDWECPGIKLLR